MLRSSSLTPLRSKLGDLADFLQRKLLNGDLLRLRSLRLKVPDSLPLPPLGAFNTTHATHAIMLLATYTSHREPIYIYIYIKLWWKESRRREFVKFVEIFSLLMQHAHARSTFYQDFYQILAKKNQSSKLFLFKAF